MWAAVVFPIRPENVACTRIVKSTSSMVTVANPVPGEALGGASLGPSRDAVYTRNAPRASWAPPAIPAAN